MYKVLVKGPALTRSGYGEQTRFAIRSLTQKADLYDLYLGGTLIGSSHISQGRFLLHVTIPTFLDLLCEQSLLPCS